MKHRFLTILSSLTAALCLCSGLVACGGNGGSRGEDGNAEKGEPGHVHTADDFEANNREHWKICTICGDKFSIEGHSYDTDNTCKVCEFKLIYTEGLEYIIDIETDSYALTEIGEATEAEIVLPAYYKGKAVTKIEESAFSGSSSLESIVIPDTVTSIGPEAFAGCSSLASIEIPKSVTSIGREAFGSCSSLTRIEVAQGNAVYHSSGNCLIETNRKILIAGCKTSKIPDDGSVTSIEAAFRGCSELTSIVIPDSVTSIGFGVFKGCSLLSAIQFKGTVEEWNEIQKDTSWDSDTGDFLVNCTNGTIDKNGNMT